jgi:hypothetical protein
VYEELAKPENNTHLTDELIDKILAFPHDALRQDLEQIIRYHISLGCDDIPDEYDNETEGVDIYAKCEVFPAVVQIGLRHPERREEVIEWFRQVLRFATEDLPEGDAFDSELAGLLVYDIIDLQAVELKPELDIDGILKPFMPQNLRGDACLLNCLAHQLGEHLVGRQTM